MNRQIKRVAVLALGWLFIFLGIVGLFLPILQGILFLLIGLLILSSEYVWAHHLLEKLKRRFPRIATQMDAATVKAQGLMQRFSRKPAEAKPAAKDQV